MGFSVNLNPKTEEINEADIPSAQGYWTPAPGGFMVEFRNGRHTSSDVLIASGGALSTIDRQEAERLGLEIKSASPLRIIFGFEPHSVSTISKSVATLSGSVSGFNVPPVDIRIVDQYNVKPIVLATDWLIEADIVMSFNPERLLPGQSLHVRRDYPSVRAYCTSSPGGFKVDAKIGSQTCEDILIATSVGISTMEKSEAERLGFPILRASPLRIIFGPPGNTYSVISDSQIDFTGSITNVEVPPFKVRLVDHQNVKLILGMDWIEGSKIGLLFNPNRICILENEGLEELLRRTRS